LVEARSRQETERIKAEEAAAKIRASLDAEKAKAEAETKALVEARSRQETERIKAEEAAAKIRASLDAEKAKADAEAKALAEARSKQEAERIKAEEESTRIRASLNAEKAKANAEAKASEEAERHTQASANAALLRGAQTAPVKNKAPSRIRVRRKPFPLGKIVAGTLFVALTSIGMLPYLMPLDNYIVPIEKKLSDQFNQPVHIGSLHAKIFPWPKLQLEKVTVGSKEELRAANVELTFDPLSIFSTVKNLREVVVNDVTLDARSLEKELVWLQRIGQNSNCHYSHVALQAVKISSTEVSLPALNGLVEFSGSGRIEKVALRTGDSKFDFSLQAAASRWQLSLNAKDTTLPFFSNVLFDDLAANGEIASSGANFSNVDAQAFGGFLHGNAKLTWQHGWQLQGHFGANGVDLVKLFPNFGVSGELQGDTNFTAFGNVLSQIAGSTLMNGTFSVNKGVVNTLDMVETLRQGDRQVGRTHFDVATGIFQVNGRGQHIHQLHLTSGMLNANGSFDASANGQLSGQLSLELKARGGLSQLSLSGTLNDPVWRLEK